jgi:hypothetical protein
MPPLSAFRAIGILAAFQLLLTGGSALTQAVPTWRAAEDLRIGGEDANTTFSPGIELLAGGQGSIYVLDRLENRVRVFDARGRFVRSFGREGAGPGEFQGPDALGWLGDTLWVSDPNQFRVAFFRADGSVIRTARIATRASASYPAGMPMAMLSGGSVLVMPSPPASVVVTGTVNRVPLLRVDRLGQVLDTLDWHSLDNNVFQVAGNRQRRTFMYQPLKDTELLSVAPDGRSLVIVERRAATRSRGASFLVTRLTAGGDTIFSRRIAYAPSPTPAGFRRDRAREMADVLARGRSGLSQGEAVSRISEQLYVPPFLPPVTSVVAGRDGTTWIRREEGAGSTVLWQVLNERGAVEASVRLPSRAFVKQASRTYLWAVAHDDLDVPYVVRYRINAPARRGR